MFDRTRFLSVLADAGAGAVAIVVMEAFSTRREIPRPLPPRGVHTRTCLHDPKRTYVTAA